MSIEINGNLIVIAHKSDVMPSARLDDGAASEKFVGAIAVEKNQFAFGAGFMCAADAEVITVCFFIAFISARKEITSDGPRVVRQAIPKPEFNRIVFVERDLSVHSTSGKMKGAIDFVWGGKV